MRLRPAIVDLFSAYQQTGSPSLMDSPFQAQQVSFRPPRSGPVVVTVLHRGDEPRRLSPAKSPVITV